MPQDITEQCSKDKTARQCIGDDYLRTQDIKTQLVAADLLSIKRAFYYLIWVLEEKLDPEGDKEASNEAEDVDEAYEPDFHIPAVTCWIKHNGQKLCEGLAKDELKNWDKRDFYIPRVMKHFDQPMDRWLFWKERLIEVFVKGPDESVRNTAESAVEYLGSIDAEKA